MFRAVVVLSLICMVIGEDDDKIVGGRTAMVQDFPYAASLQRNEVHICGACILTSQHLVTAAHCVVPIEKLPINLISVRVGSTLWSSGGQLIGVKKLIKHQRYDPATKVFDIAMIKLKREMEFDVTVQPIELATKIPGDGKPCKICGWGLKKERAESIPMMLQQADVLSISREKCSSVDYEYHEDVKETMICANNNGVDACQGDSGGPLVYNGKLLGVTSFGRGCGRPEYPGIYTSIPACLKWIAKFIETL